MDVRGCFMVIVIYFSYLSSVPAIVRSTVVDERSDGFRIERISSTGIRVNFTWWSTGAASWLQASRKCAGIGAQLPKVSEMRYFYKTLRSHTVNSSYVGATYSDNDSSHAVVFYLAEILEATMDYPNTESGERMCIVVEKRPNTPIHLAETEAVRSCLTHVNLIVCRSLIDADNRLLAKGTSSLLDDDISEPCGPYDDRWIGPEPQWIIELKRKAEGSRDLLCFKPTTFYLCVAGIGILLFTTTVTSVSMAWQNCRRHRRLKGRGGGGRSADEYRSGTPDPTEASDFLPGKRPAISAGTGLHSPASGHMDILADSAFYRPAPSRGGDCPSELPRDSYKQMLINEAYQKMSNGLLPGNRLGSKFGQNNLSSVRGAAGSARRSQNKIQ